MDSNKNFTKKFTKKFNSKVINIQYFHRKTQMEKLMNIMLASRKQGQTNLLIESLLLRSQKGQIRRKQATSRVRPRFFDQVGDQTTNASIGNKYFFTK